MSWMLLCMILQACGPNNKQESSQADNAKEEYHADNDIAMTVRSIADAIRVGEPLDTGEYNFRGVLTDGQGHPLYTDISGVPGNWEVKVLCDSIVEIRNTQIGDLMPDDLESYLAYTLGLSERDVITDVSLHDSDHTELVSYDIGHGEMHIETRRAIAPNGLEGSDVRIRLSAK